MYIFMCKGGKVKLCSVDFKGKHCFKTGETKTKWGGKALAHDHKQVGVEL